MIKSLSLAALVGLMMATSAQANPCCCGGNGSAPATAAVATPVPATAQAPSANRSYSYNPAMPAAAVAAPVGNGTGVLQPMSRRIIGSYGEHRAGAKANGNY